MLKVAYDGLSDDPKSDGGLLSVKVNNRNIHSNAHRFARLRSCSPRA